MTEGACDRNPNLSNLRSLAKYNLRVDLACCLKLGCRIGLLRTVHGVHSGNLFRCHVVDGGGVTLPAHNVPLSKLL
jgi:hypothetical protein